MKKFILLIITFNIAITINAQVSKSVNVTSAGTLSTLFSAVEKSTITDLTITGNIDSRDFVTLRDAMTKLSVLDISKVIIREYVGISGTIGPAIKTYHANEIPEHSFCNPNTVVSKKTLKTIYFPNSITAINEDAFLGCSGLTSLTIPISVTLIGSGAFSFCTGLKSLIIPNSVNSIGASAFDYCDGLGSIYACRTIPIDLGSSHSFYMIKSDCYLFVPFGSKSAYQAAKEWKNFTHIVEIQLPTIATKAINAITTTTASAGGSITNEGSSVITSRGICWSKTLNPTTADSITDEGSGNEAFTSFITGLTPGIKYHIRAYASSNIGTFYGADSTFRTLDLPSTPSVYTRAVEFFSPSAVSSGGTVSGNYTYPTKAFGVCCSTAPNPTIDNDMFKNNIVTKVDNYSDVLNSIYYSSTISGLSLGTTYYFRAYATNEIGTSYGEERTFTTFNLPTVSTLAISKNESTSVSTGGNVTNNGGTAILERGIVLESRTTTTPVISTITVFKSTINGDGTGIFNSIISGLKPGTQYSVWAYAKNIVDISYGSPITFTTAVISGISDNILGNIEFYPNPTNRIINIRIVSGNYNGCVVNIINSLGQKIYTSKLYNEQTSIDISELSKSGFILIQVMNTDGIVLGKKKILIK